MRKISNRDNTGAGKLPERGIAGASELPKRLNDQKGWKRVHDVLASESAGLTPAERQRRYDQVTAFGNSWPVTETQERLEVKDVVSPEEGVGDDLHETDTRVDEAHSRIVDLTDYLWSIPGFEAYYIALEDAAREDADSDAVECTQGPFDGDEYDYGWFCEEDAGYSDDGYEEDVHH